MACANTPYVGVGNTPYVGVGNTPYVGVGNTPYVGVGNTPYVGVGNTPYVACANTPCIPSSLTTATACWQAAVQQTCLKLSLCGTPGLAPRQLCAPRSSWVHWFRPPHPLVQRAAVVRLLMSDARTRLGEQGQVRLR